MDCMPSGKPSARMLAEMARSHHNSYTRFVLERSHAHRAALLALPYPKGLELHFAKYAHRSVDDQRKIEASDTMPFEEYRKAYLAPERLVPRRREQQV